MKEEEKTERALVYHQPQLYTKVEGLTEPQKAPRVTVVGIVEEVKGSATLTFGFAKCTSRDQYSRKKGVTIAYYRANVNPQFMIGVKKPDVNSMFLTIARKMAIEVAMESQLGNSLITGLPVPEKILHFSSPVKKEKVKFTPEMIEQLKAEKQKQKEQELRDMEETAKTLAGRFDGNVHSAMDNLLASYEAGKISKATLNQESKILAEINRIKFYSLVDAMDKEFNRPVQSNDGFKDPGTDLIGVDWDIDIDEDKKQAAQLFSDYQSHQITQEEFCQKAQEQYFSQSWIENCIREVEK